MIETRTNENIMKLVTLISCQTKCTVLGHLHTWQILIKTKWVKQSEVITLNTENVMYADGWGCLFK